MFMSHSKIFTAAKLLLILALMGMFVLLGVISCKNGGEPDKKETQTVDTTQKEAVVLSADDFSHVMISKNDLVSLFNPPTGSIKKILLQFIDEGAGGKKLLAYGASKDGKKTTGPVVLNPVTGTTPVNIPGKKYLGNLQLSQKDINGILGQPPGKKIDPSTAKDLYFKPTTHASYPNYVLYYVDTVATFMMMAPPPPPTNPSPPAPPCDPCDQ
jgi:hypothetical protein